MIPYLVVFALSSALVAIAGSQRNRSRFVRIFFSLAAVLLVSALAGIRDFDLGTDIASYGNRIFYSMVSAGGIQDVVDYAIQRSTPGEFGYLFLNFLVSRVSSDAHIFYFVLAFISSGLMLIAIMLTRSLGSPVVMWLTYLLTAYVEGYNLLRQSLALSLAVLGIAFVLQSRYRTGLIVGLMGLLFHNSALIFVIMWAAATLVHSRKRKGKPAVRLVLIATIAVTLLVSPLLDLLGSVLSDTAYERYLDDSARSGRAFGVDALYRLIPLFAGVILLRIRRQSDSTYSSSQSFAGVQASKPSRFPWNGLSTTSGTVGVALPQREQPGVASTTQSDKLVQYAAIVLLTLLTIDLALLPIREISYPFYRILVYFGYMRILAYGVLVNLAQKHRTLLALGAVAFSAAYFLFIVVLRNEAFYSSEILEGWLRMI